MATFPLNLCFKSQEGTLAELQPLLLKLTLVALEVDQVSDRNVVDVLGILDGGVHWLSCNRTRRQRQHEVDHPYHRIPKGAAKDATPTLEISP